MPRKLTLTERAMRSPRAQINLTPSQQAEIRLLYESGDYRTIDLAATFGVPPYKIADVIGPVYRRRGAANDSEAPATPLPEEVLAFIDMTPDDCTPEQAHHHLMYIKAYVAQERETV